MKESSITSGPRPFSFADGTALLHIDDTAVDAARAKSREWRTQIKRGRS
jgi:hypothetical protein